MRAGRQEGGGEHVDDGAAFEIEVAGSGGVGVDELAAVGEGEGGGAFFAALVAGDRVTEVGDVHCVLAARAFDGDGQ